MPNYAVDINVKSGRPRVAGILKNRRRPKFSVRTAETVEDMRAAQQLRHAVFRSSDDATETSHHDRDAYDMRCTHVLIESVGTGELVATFRMMPLESGAEINSTYSAQFYSLEALKGYDRPIVEIGRFCIRSDQTDPDILRAAWAAIAAHVDKTGTELLIGCSSFKGIDESMYADAFAMLRERHLAPRRWWPRIKAPNVFKFAERLKLSPDRTKALRTMPPLLRSYLSMGGWVSDHAVIDRDLNTLHVFTGLEVRKIPPARRKALLSLAN